MSSERPLNSIESGLEFSRKSLEAGRQLGELGMRVAGAIGRSAISGLQEGARLTIEAAGQPFDTDWRALRREVLVETPIRFVDEVEKAITGQDPELARTAADMAVRALTHARESNLGEEVIDQLAARVEQGTAHVDHMLREGDPGNPFLPETPVTGDEDGPMPPSP